MRPRELDRSVYLVAGTRFGGSHMEGWDITVTLDVSWIVKEPISTHDGSKLLPKLRRRLVARRQKKLFCSSYAVATPATSRSRVGSPK